MSPARARRRAPLITALLAVALVMSGCAGETADSGASAPESGAVIEHAHGRTTVPEHPQRVVTLGLMSADIVAALGVNPVGVEELWGANDNGYLPWFDDYITANFDERPTVIPALEDGPNYEAIQALEPDLILGLYTGISDVEYARLSEIAPTIPYIDGPFDPGTWQGMTETIGTALGKEDEADRLVSETESFIEELVSSHPVIEDKTFVWGLALTPGDPGMGAYLAYDARVRITEALGLVSTPYMETLEKTSEGNLWYSGVSLENLSDVPADVFIAWPNNGISDVDYSLANEVFLSWDPIASGSYVIFTEPASAAAITAPTVLSMPYILPGYIDHIAAALQGTPWVEGR
ncbi:ABC transporter substrate-binding protein [Microbacterium sp. TNHR37B]|uniref:ABC transporter substrate-binding protein n=1 Tax=Microbacterium sp. TNHR37B TaxID=1775956 RepID=UPI0007B2842E|nr:ABC transporter substrate-binding protein [Microbacterium sp. TNHR37B]KZE90562.1 Fe(3+)-citrate-binding protein YfmC [Microbacterium sp. TNHR37B]